MAEDAQVVPAKRVWVKPEISLGDIIMSVGFAIGGVSSFFVLQTRVDVNQARFEAFRDEQMRVNKMYQDDLRNARVDAQSFRAEIIAQLRSLNDNVVLLREKSALNEERSRRANGERGDSGRR